PATRAFLDFSEPLVLIQNGTLHHYADPARSPQDIMAEYVEALPSGSYVVLAHFFDPENEDSDLARRMEQVFIHSPMGSGSFRTQAEIEGMFPGLAMVEPGVVPCATWWPDGPQLQPLAPAQRCIAGGVGRKP
ncbi:MAG: SAM-dependent methyltransferase, partial [Pseudonocardia sediminis]